MAQRTSVSTWYICLIAILVLGGCNSSSDDPGPFTIGGTVSGLAAGESLVLENNGGAALTIVSASGPFSFSAPVGRNGSYSITVNSQPTGQTCTVAKGSGAGVTANIDSVQVTCASSSYTLSGTVSGLTGNAEVALENNGADALTVSGNGSFVFSTPIAFDSAYLVTVSTQPANETCTVSNGMGAGVTANLSNISVVCSINAYPVGGVLSGLAAGVQVTLDDNGDSPLTLTANGAFTFSVPIAAQSAYNVTVGTEPQNQTCTVTNGEGSGVSSSVTAIAVICSNDTYTIGGSLSGLSSGMQVTIENNGADPLTLTANGSFTFVTPVALSTAYDVTVSTQPTGQTCGVSSGSGSDVNENITSVSINCTP